MFVEMVEEVSLLRLVDAGQHVLGVQERPDDAHQLDRGSHVCIADHALDDNVHQQPVIVRSVDLQSHQVRRGGEETQGGRRHLPAAACTPALDWVKSPR